MTNVISSLFELYKPNLKEEELLYTGLGRSYRKIYCSILYKICITVGAEVIRNISESDHSCSGTELE